MITKKRLLLGLAAIIPLIMLLLYTVGYTSSYNSTFIPLIRHSTSGTSNAYYMQSYTALPYMYNLGCQNGKQIADGDRKNRVIILFFGNPAFQKIEIKPGEYEYIYGTVYFRGGGVDRTFFDIQHTYSLIREFAKGVNWCSPYNVKVTIAVGTSNSQAQLFYAYSADGLASMEEHGKKWGQLISDLNALKFDKILFAGALNAELAFSESIYVDGWTDGFSSVNYNKYMYVGDCAGCADATNNLDPGVQVKRAGNLGTFAWSKDKIVEFSSRTPGAEAFPMIYRKDGVQSQQWFLMSYYASTVGTHQPIRFRGVLSQYQSCLQGNSCVDEYGIRYDNTPIEAWRNLADLVMKGLKANVGDNPPATPTYVYFQPLPTATKAVPRGKTDILWAPTPTPVP